MSAFADKRVVILGASSPGGIGAAAARLFKTAGARVLIAARREYALAETAAELGVESAVCDATDEASLAALASRARDVLGGVDIAVYAPGRAASRSIAKADLSELRELCDLQFIGAVMFMKHMGADMPSGGAMVVVSSVTATTPGRGLTAYGGTKAASEYAVKVAALEYGRKGIRVNAVAPGFTHTDMTASLLEQPSFEAAFAREAALGRLGDVGHAASAILWLASESCYATGDVLQISGGAQLGRLPRADEMTDTAG